MRYRNILHEYIFISMKIYYHILDNTQVQTYYMKIYSNIILFFQQNMIIIDIKILSKISHHNKKLYIYFIFFE
jgi:hypothetical protein